MANRKHSLLGTISQQRRRLLAALGAGSLLFSAARSGHAQEAAEGMDELHFPGDEPAHKVVYQFNKADADYQQHVLFSVGAMLRKYNDNVRVVVTCFGPGIHILAREPLRPVSEEIQQRVASLAQYGVAFHACANTMKSLDWTAEDLLPLAEVVDVGAADMMELQEQGYAYISW